MDTILKIIIDRAGGVTAVARACGIKHPNVCQWLARERTIPVWHAQKLAQMADVDMVHIIPYVREEVRGLLK